ncbi:NADPH-dependent F420 reductase [Xanthobacteraceae bacterium A53D]
MEKIAVIGGSGALGFGLALRWALAGQSVIIGSRSEDTARKAADEIRQTASDRTREVQVAGMENAAAAAHADIVVLAVPWQQQSEAVSSIAGGLKGKVLVDTTVPLVPPKVGTVQLPPAGASAVTVQSLVGADVRVVSAFQNVSAQKLRSLDPLDCDVLVCGDDKAARDIVMGLVEAAGLRGFHAGPLANAAAAEALTSVLITINRQFKCHAGIRIVGLEA